LDNLNLKEYAGKLIEQGFDDLDMLKAMMRTDFPLTNSHLKDAGIRKPGHRARILVRLEFDSGMFAENENLRAAIFSIRKESNSQNSKSQSFSQSWRN